MNANQIIDALGGTAEVARLCRVKQPSVSEWRRNGIPDARMQFLEVVRADVFARLRGGDHDKQDCAEPQDPAQSPNTRQAAA